MSTGPEPAVVQVLTRTGILPDFRREAEPEQEHHRNLTREKLASPGIHITQLPGAYQPAGDT